jgi:hypothetical protein
MSFGITTTTCRSCGRRIVCDRDELSVDHEAPECDEFKSLIAQFRAKGFRSIESIVYRDVTGRKVKA